MVIGIKQKLALDGMHRSRRRPLVVRTNPSDQSAHQRFILSAFQLRGYHSGWWGAAGRKQFNLPQYNSVSIPHSAGSSMYSSSSQIALRCAFLTSMNFIFLHLPSLLLVAALLGSTGGRDVKRAIQVFPASRASSKK